MTVKPTIEALYRLISIHETLLTSAEEKMAAVKAGDAEVLQRVLVNERKCIQMLNEAETNREKAVTTWFRSKDLPQEDITVTHMLEIIEDEAEKRELTEQTITLTEMITALKQQENLNQSLIQQSLQFVQLSLDMMNPTIKNMNYGKKTSAGTRLSMFDSKA